MGKDGMENLKLLNILENIKVIILMELKKKKINLNYKAINRKLAEFIK